MTAQTVSPPDVPCPEPGDEPGIDLADHPHPLDAAREHIEAVALADGAVGRVGLELEFHLVDLRAPGRRPHWAEVRALVDGLPPMPSGSAVTLEPGGQLELSPPPADGIAAAVADLRADRAALREHLAGSGYGTAPLGTDPARHPRRVNPSERYAAMESHFAALDCIEAGTTMMTATAALQVNVEAGPAEGWSERLRRIHDLTPVLMALSACSPLLDGSSSGWASMRQQAWLGIDADRTHALAGDHGDPRTAWAEYALHAPVMLVRGEHTEAVTRRVPFADWVTGDADLTRPVTFADVDYHLTTLFPPVRPRGFLEIRCLDAVPDRWWPALAALTTTLVDDPESSDRAAELTEPVHGDRTLAARAGLLDPVLHRAAVGCLEVAARRCDPQLRGDVEAYAELVLSGRTPGDDLRDRAARTDPLTALEEEARA